MEKLRVSFYTFYSIDVIQHYIHKLLIWCNYQLLSQLVLRFDLFWLLDLFWSVWQWIWRLAGFLGNVSVTLNFHSTMLKGIDSFWTFKFAYKKHTRTHTKKTSWIICSFFSLLALKFYVNRSLPFQIMSNQFPQVNEHCEVVETSVLSVITIDLNTFF